MITKIFGYYGRGISGLLRNPKLNPWEKSLICADLVRLWFHGFLRIVLPTIERKFRLLSVGVSVRYVSYLGLAYMFNEIFCIGEYPVPSELALYVDVGANIGLTILWFKYFFPDARVIAFEPDPQNFALLKRNIEDNAIKNCTLHMCALGNSTGTVPFYRLNDNIQNLDSGLSVNQDLPYTTLRVSMKRLSGSLPHMDISLLKMDIEGGEYDVFADLFRSTAIRKFKRILFESHEFTRKNSHDLSAIKKRLGSKGALCSYQNGWHTSMNIWTKAGFGY